MQQSAQKLRKNRKLLLFLPLLVLPFMTLFFWAMGGGKGVTGAQAATSFGGLNTTLPQPQPENAPENKLSLYQQALKESASLEEARRQDPYSLPPTDTRNAGIWEQDAPENTIGYLTDPNEEKVNQKLEAFKAALQEQPQMPAYQRDNYQQEPDEPMSVALDQVQAAMRQAQDIGGGSEGDPELNKLDGMLQKIIDIQHPELAKNRMETVSQQHRGQVYSVASRSQANVAVLLNPPQPLFHDSNTNGRTVGAFFESSAVSRLPSADNKAVAAVIHETQTLTSGATIKLRLTEAIFINGVQIPKGTFAFAVCQLEGERMRATVKAIRYKHHLFPVALAIVDMDGIEGIRIPGAISREAAKQGMEQGVQSLNLMTMDQSLGAQAASAGIETAKSFLGHKVKLIRATVRAGYPVLLVDENKRDQ